MPDFFQLDGRVALVTGGAQGIGRAIALRLHSAGARVAILDSQPEATKSAANEIGALPIVGDVTSEADVSATIERVERELGPLAILVNNAGITGRAVRSWELTAGEVKRVFDVNFVGPFLLCKAAVPGMLARRYGRIVNVASIAGKEGNPTLMPYSASKAALINMTKALAKELAGQGDLTVNAISPAVIRTPILDELPQTTIDYMISRIPIGRTGTVEEIAALVHYLSSYEASFCTGQCYDISGGRATY